MCACMILYSGTSNHGASSDGTRVYQKLNTPLLPNHKLLSAQVCQWSTSVLEMVEGCDTSVSRLVFVHDWSNTEYCKMYCLNDNYCIQDTRHYVITRSWFTLDSPMKSISKAKAIDSRALLQIWTDWIANCLCLCTWDMTPPPKG